MKTKKKFKDTIVGKGLIGILGVVNPTLVNVLSGATDIGQAMEEIIKSDDLTYEQKEHLKQEAKKLELEEFNTEVRDRDSARLRQVRVAEAGGSDNLFQVVGWGVTLAFSAIIFAAVFWEVPKENQRLFDMAFGAVVTAMTQVVSYYFGSSKGSADKTKMLQQGAGNKS